jgi:hypothetical protein
MAEIAFDEKNVSFTNTDAALVFCVAKTTKPYKPFALAIERDKNGKETGWYTVPKSLVFAHRAEKLADGSRVNIMRTKTVLRAEREALLKAGIEKGLKVRPLDEEKPSRERPAALTLETLLSQQPKL